MLIYEIRFTRINLKELNRELQIFGTCLLQIYHFHESNPKHSQNYRRRPVSWQYFLGKKKGGRSFSVKMAKKGSSIQALYDLCRKTFSLSGTHPSSSQAINKLSSLLGIYLFLLLCLIASLSEIFTQFWVWVCFVLKLKPRNSINEKSGVPFESEIFAFVWY